MAHPSVNLSLQRRLHSRGYLTHSAAKTSPAPNLPLSTLGDDGLTKANEDVADHGHHGAEVHADHSQETTEDGVKSNKEHGKDVDEHGKDGTEDGWGYVSEGLFYRGAP